MCYFHLKIEFLIKEDFTKRLKQHLKSSLKVFKELISFESDNLKEIKIVPRVTKLLRDTGTLISKSNLLVPIDITIKKSVKRLVNYQPRIKQL